MKFSVGDVVVLKSGGPRMTVESIDAESSKAHCVWFDKAVAKHGDFPIDLLTSGRSSGPLTGQIIR